MFLPRDSWRRHGPGRQNFVQSGVGEHLPFANEIPDRTPCCNRRLGDLGGCRVSDVRAQRGCQRRAAIEQLTTPLFVGLQGGDAPLLHDPHGVGQDTGRVNGVPGDDRHHHIELELSRVGCGENGGITTVNLETHLIDHLGHGRVHFARHDRRAGLNCWQPNLGQARPRSAAEQPEVGRDLVHLDGQPAQRG
jgi:hypothetical protein